jgi:DNA-binding response OmpR family regulator
MARILVAEDSQELQLIIKKTLSGVHDVTSALTIAQSKKEALQSSFDLIILDISFPDGDGYQLCTELRASDRHSETPIIFLTSKAELVDKMMAFSLGADDYLMKPFEPLELRARVDARLKRKGPKNAQAQSASKGDFKFDLSLQRVLVANGDKEIEIHLTPAEFKIFYFLAKNEGQAFNKEQLVKTIWGNDVHVIEDNIYTHISTIRKKLGTRANCIECIPRVGYRFSANGGK